jgi:hypothetical protein
MSKVIKILTLNNEIEARAMEQLLKDNNIPFNLKSLRDPAYDGIFQVHMGWGFIEAPEDYKDEIINVYNNFKNK